ncbi:MAG TPA: protein kinase, partial [Aggregatilineales bacterium]|nr:protein kinase [Aggregatilineales bacterium]
MPAKAQSPVIGKGRYRLEEPIGAGGMGTVYRAVDTQSGDMVAVKLLQHDPFATSPQSLERFIREGEALRRLNHPNIVKMLGALDEGDEHYLVMEYVAGGSLRDALRAHGPLPVNRVLSIALELSDALTRAHHLKIIHRDIKPDNVLLAEDGTPRLTDFGVARLGKNENLTEDGTLIGTLAYLSPEACQGDVPDARSDLWAFGVVLFEMLLGTRPFGGEHSGAILTSILTKPVPDLEALRPETPIALVDLIYRMLEKDRNARIPSARLVGAELEAIAETLDSGLHPNAAFAAHLSRAASTATQTTSAVLQTPQIPLTPSASTGLPTPHPALHGLPAQTTPFVGRVDELAALGKFMADSDTRLVTILGPGGMGKTRLGLEAATRTLSDFPGGAWFVPLAPLGSAEHVVPAIAEALNYPMQQDGRSLAQQILDYLSDRQALLILDNFEHVLDGVGIVSEILQAAPDMKIIATSRERLNLGGETVFVLGGMDFPAWETPEDALNYSAVKLFVQSARRARPGFELQAADLDYVARICRLVQGMPLGILLAAAWVGTLSLQEIADEITHSLDFLATEQRDMPERQRSLRAVFEY